MSFFRNTTAMFSDRKLEQKTIALAGNPNVGKSTVFNALTGLKQHTGNWPGKTVSNARGSYSDGIYNYTLVDVPGTYSLLANSYEEEIARDFINLFIYLFINLCHPCHWRLYAHNFTKICMIPAAGTARSIPNIPKKKPKKLTESRTKRG